MKVDIVTNVEKAGQGFIFKFIRQHLPREVRRAKYR